MSRQNNVQTALRQNKTCFCVGVKLKASEKKRPFYFHTHTFSHQYNGAMGLLRGGAGIAGCIRVRVPRNTSRRVPKKERMRRSRTVEKAMACVAILQIPSSVPFTAPSTASNPPTPDPSAAWTRRSFMILWSNSNFTRTFCMHCPPCMCMQRQKPW